MRILIPKKLQQRAVDLAHSGHHGIVKTKALIREKVRFSSIDLMVERTVQKCMVSQVAIPTITKVPMVRNQH